MMQWLDAIINVGLVVGLLADGDVELIHSCFVTKGRRKGRLLASAPSSFKEPMRAAAWQAMISTLAPGRMNIATVCWLLPADAKAVFNRVDDWTRMGVVAYGLNAYAQGFCDFNIDGPDNPEDPDRFARRMEMNIDAALAKRAYA